jgi:PAS domain S-box-containing protein
MNDSIPAEGKWTERTNDAAWVFGSEWHVFQQFFEHTVDATWLFDAATGRFVNCNQAAVALLGGSSKEQLVGLRPDELAPPLQPDGTPSVQRVAELARRVQEQGSLRFEWLARGLDGKLVPLEVLSTAVSSLGSSYHVIIARDLTERKAAETALRESEKKFRLLFESSADGILMLDPETQKFIDCNEAAVRMSRGGSREWLLAQPVAALAPDFQPDGALSTHRAIEMISRALREGTQRFEWMARARNNEELPLEVLVTPMPVADRNLLVTVIREIPHRKQEGMEIRLANLELERRIAARTHELVRANLQLRGEIQERERAEALLKALYQISEASHVTDDLDSLYRQIHTTIQSLMPAGNFYIAAYDPATELFSFPYFVDEMDPPPGPRKLTTGLTSYVLRTGRPLLVNRRSPIRKEGAGVAVVVEAAGEIPYVEAGSPAAVWLGVPLKVRGETIGVMAVQDYRDENAYGNEDKQILTFVAEQTATAIERKRAQQALRESEAKFRALFEASSQGVMLHDEKEFLEANSATVRILGYNNAAELLGKHPAETSAPIQPNGEPADVLARKYIGQCMEQGSARFEWLARNPRGQDVPLEVILTRIPMGGRPIIQAVINDIAERKRAEAELLRALAREKELGQLKSNFVSMVSHEFRTPLGIIMSSAEILRDYLEKLEASDRQHHLQSITRNTRRMADLMEEVLLLSRFEAGKMNFQPAPLDLANLCRRIVGEAYSATDRVCPIELHAPSLPGAAEADERLVRHIFSNLLSNAVKYSEPGSPVRLSLEAHGGEAVCTVQDAGIGIPESDMEWLFNAFHRGRNVGARPGTGLGLVVVKRCVELHGGRIKIESKVGAGTTISVRLPVFGNT